jgi:phosphatidylserine/phosphatidylglycerophosphate/cardiolipin synthase-like enzyme
MSIVVHVVRDILLHLSPLPSLTSLLLISDTTQLLQKQDIPEISRQISALSRGTCQVQVLRSTGKWSVGENTEQSIQNAYIDAIQSAQHLLYIENQVIPFPLLLGLPCLFCVHSSPLPL